MSARYACNPLRVSVVALLAAMALSFAAPVRADCSLTNVGLTPLPDLGFGLYQGLTGGFYPGGANQRPPAHEAAGLEMAENEVAPRDTAGNVDTNSGKIVLLSVGMSNTTQEFSEFKRRTDRDAGRNPQLIIVDGAQGGQDAVLWTNAEARAWTNVQHFLTNAGLTSNQVQVLWIKQALAGPNRYGAFPAHARALQEALETVLRLARQRFPNLKLAYLSSRTRAYVLGPQGLNPEPLAYEGAFAMKWLIEKQLAGGLDYDPVRGPVAVPWLSWGPYLWADGTQPRSDGFVWLCADLNTDFTHPSASGVDKVAQQLLAFFKTDPTATPWFLRRTIRGQPPTCAATADVTNGPTPLTVQFTAQASDPDGTITQHLWTFEDGTFSTNTNPVKVFPAPGQYRARLTVTDNEGNTATGSVVVNVTSTFARWRQAKFSPAELADWHVSGADADPDGDGAVNKLEYALGLEPKVADPPAAIRPRPAIAGGQFTLNFSRYKAAADVVFVVEASADLITWVSGLSVLESFGTLNHGPTETVTFRLVQPVQNAPHGFVRARLEDAP